VYLKDIISKDLIGYTCSYTPVELLSATGLRPYRLLHGDIDLSKEGEKVVRVDACPMVKSNLAFVSANKERFAALVGSTGCDMESRMFDIVAELTDIPVFVFHNPRTDNPMIFNDEIDWLIKQLENL
jgi:benzoyl-CoA reductase/2-hydroxyglutaryl-CoA dehydratase subunit BcrC/BadD/HgdB